MSCKFEVKDRVEIVGGPARYVGKYGYINAAHQAEPEPVYEVRVGLDAFTFTESELELNAKHKATR